MIEFNFKIVYRLNKQDVKSNNLTQRSRNLLKDCENSRHEYNHQMLLKKHYLNTKVKKAIEIALKLMNKKRKKIATLTVIIYELSEEKLYAKKELNNNTLTEKLQFKKS